MTTVHELASPSFSFCFKSSDLEPHEGECRCNIGLWTRQTNSITPLHSFGQIILSTFLKLPLFVLYSHFLSLSLSFSLSLCTLVPFGVGCTAWRCSIRDWQWHYTTISCLLTSGVPWSSLVVTQPGLMLLNFSVKLGIAGSFFLSFFSFSFFLCLISVLCLHHLTIFLSRLPFHCFSNSHTLQFSRNSWHHFSSPLLLLVVLTEKGLIWIWVCFDSRSLHTLTAIKSPIAR